MFLLSFYEDMAVGSQYGGANINKFLAYLALTQSASEPYDIDLDRCIVVDDFETMVNGEVDFIDLDTYEIERKYMDIPINHTVGCGTRMKLEQRWPNLR
ncbi:hypothetical protein FPZ45_02515 [Cohnella terricola]|uniref:Uncharacterized protein n=1 Tax=Cohnella terricola TaxID=1289167 RepID=A0A559JX58_9BACL|nr:hypothetical protein FPZ45_02515 [Cohnella terricola]